MAKQGRSRRREKKQQKYIFVVGGVMSGVGKGIATSSIGKILQARGLSVTALKIDPYINVDAGTMNPTEHGEVFVLGDGTECDQDMGNYERFLGTTLTRANYMTTGSVYLSVINKERALKYGGKQVEVVPRIPLEVLDKIDAAMHKARAEVGIIEIGGTVGEYENILFLEAVRMLKIRQPQDVALVLVSYVPALGAGGNELKTKPTQHAVRNLNSVGLHPDIILARAHVPMDRKRKEKISFMCSLEEKDVISAPNVTSVYEVPVNFEDGGLTDRLLQKLHLRATKKDLRDWRHMVKIIRTKKAPVRIGIVGKYFNTGDFELTDSYISVIESIKHAAFSLKREPVIEWINSEAYEQEPERLKELERLDGVLIPGGFGSRGVEGKIAAIEFCRKKRIPYFGLCYGMQLAVIEYARNAARLKDAHTHEVRPDAPHRVIDIMPDQKDNVAQENYGATMRLGQYPAKLKPGTIAETAYGVRRVMERHRHRYEVNPKYIERLERAGLVFSATSPDGVLMEIAELPRSVHPFFLGTQFHPEFQSSLLSPHPLFVAFVRAAIQKKA